MWSVVGRELGAEEKARFTGKQRSEKEKAGTLLLS